MAPIAARLAALAGATYIESVRRTYYGCATQENTPEIHQNRPKMNLTLPPRVTDRAFARLAEIAEAAGEVKALRVAVEGGGCSGFQYDIRLDDPTEDDMVFERNGMKVLVDSVSLPFLSNAVIDFSEELIGARFVIENPNASSSCGCGTSFSM
jgi:iron-sulfur cluster insertion protein